MKIIFSRIRLKTSLSFTGEMNHNKRHCKGTLIAIHPQNGKKITKVYRRL